MILSAAVENRWSSSDSDSGRGGAVAAVISKDTLRLRSARSLVLVGCRLQRVGLVD